jgi:acetyltransferase-like isoleucine patch superfamily enzyme
MDTPRAGTETLAALRGTAGPPRAVVPGARQGRRLSVHNARALARWLRLRARFRNLEGPLFFIGSGHLVDVGRDARVRVGRGVRFMRGFEGRLYGEVEIGDGVVFSTGCTVSVHSRLRVGDNTGFAEWVSVHDNDHVVGARGDNFQGSGFVEAPIEIGANVWVGAKATILKGVTIGDNAVIGANSVVNRDVPANVVAAGVPARVIRELPAP